MCFSRTGPCLARILLTGALLGLCALPAAGAGTGLGPRIGLSDGPDEFFLGAQAELARFWGNARLVPSLDFGLGDGDVTTANLDFRWYLLRLPETGLRFYGSVGPSLVLSPGSDLGLSLTAGMEIPMRQGRRYNVEIRFGWGDIPDRKIALAILFGL